jgi:hypothetical protein
MNHIHCSKAVSPVWNVVCLTKCPPWLQGQGRTDPWIMDTKLKRMHFGLCGVCRMCFKRSPWVMSFNNPPKYRCKSFVLALSLFDLSIFSPDSRPPSLSYPLTLMLSLSFTEIWIYCQESLVRSDTVLQPHKCAHLFTCMQLMYSTGLVHLKCKSY